MTNVAVTASRIAKLFARVLRRLPLLFPRFFRPRRRSETSLPPFASQTALKQISASIKTRDIPLGISFMREKRDLTTVAVTASRIAKLFARVLRRLPLLFPRFFRPRRRSETSLPPFASQTALKQISASIKTRDIPLGISLVFGGEGEI